MGKIKCRNFFTYQTNENTGVSAALYMFDIHDSQNTNTINIGNIIVLGAGSRRGERTSIFYE